ncbi:hypothetical protein EX30DRAFT_110925 [Ascodesmis nigricans]|uniref:Uncharacterized protein n=1 Tax=Ascodesmis nigricans TaxID=341454 RepID=A0A4S2MST2_9PEZI|nr:hypothetical protein EX30DRAFT_110925 [Ascodesmis nigricans]
MVCQRMWRKRKEEEVESKFNGAMKRRRKKKKWEVGETKSRKKKNVHSPKGIENKLTVEKKMTKKHEDEDEEEEEEGEE